MDVDIPPNVLCSSTTSKVPTEVAIGRRGSYFGTTKDGLREMPHNWKRKGQP
jgi:hypothetical protein